MFTGIIEEVGTVKEVSPGRLVIAASKVLDSTQLGDSIAVNGACLTVTELGEGYFAVSLMPETVRRTNLGDAQAGYAVNLERALPATGRFGGHLVQGHVEATGTVLSLAQENDAIIVRYAAPPQIMRYVVSKGFIAVDGVSLTVIDRDETSFAVSLVAFTQENTSLPRRKPGDRVNLETDIIARYVEQFLKGSNQRSAGGEGSGGQEA